MRNAARVLLIDPGGRLLLVHGGDPADPSAGSWWFTPGGGMEPGESAEEVTGALTGAGAVGPAD